MNAFVKGAAGKPGSPGIPGVVGQKGESGTLGLVGYTGYQGDSGDTGPMGLKGTAGSDGEIGEQGPIGGKGSIVSKTMFLYCLVKVFRKYSYDNVPLISTGYLIDIYSCVLQMIWQMPCNMLTRNLNGGLSQKFQSSRAAKVFSR